MPAAAAADVKWNELVEFFAVARLQLLTFLSLLILLCLVSSCGQIVMLSNLGVFCGGLHDAAPCCLFSTHSKAQGAKIRFFLKGSPYKLRRNEELKYATAVPT
jgi:hypothetical protein